MTPFRLKIVTPYGPVFEGRAEALIVRTTSGDLGILAGHMDCVAPLGMGRATIVMEGKRRYGACIGGMLSVIGGNATLVATTFEWAEDIDLKRADASYDRAKSVLDDRTATDTEVRLAEARLKRALVRKGVASGR